MVSTWLRGWITASPREKTSDKCFDRLGSLSTALAAECECWRWCRPERHRLPLVACTVAVALGMSGEIAREAILLTAIPTGFFGVLFGLNYGVRSQAIGSMLTLSYLVSVITLTGAFV
jgi:Membrane transport protein